MFLVVSPQTFFHAASLEGQVRVKFYGITSYKPTCERVLRNVRDLREKHAEKIRLWYC